jgi:putative acetyltransferase
MNTDQNKIRIVDYNPTHASDFKALNLIWLDEHNLTEEHDREVLNDPQGQIIDQGGFIFIALSGDRVIGTGAIVRSENNTMEIAKMSIHKDFQGQGLSKLLMDQCISKAKSLGVSKLYLYSSTKLQTALKLYEKYGFKHVQLTSSPYETADVFMELELSTTN